jgi:hypothetical protein
VSRPHTHIVRVGETPTSIAAQYTGRRAPAALRALLRANPTKPRSGVTFASLREGEALALPDSWFAVSEGTKGRGLGAFPSTLPNEPPQINGLPSTDDIIAAGIQSGTDWLASALKIPPGAADIIAEIASIPATLIQGYLSGVQTAAEISGGATGVAAVVGLVSEDAAGALLATAGVAAATLPVAGVFVAAFGLAISFVKAIQGPPQLTTEGPDGPFTMDVSYYVSTALPQAATDAPKYFMMDVYAFSVQETISVSDGVINQDGNITFLVPGGNGPIGSSFVVVPGAQSLLHACQLSAAAAAAPLVANILALYIGAIGPSTLPLVTSAEWAQIQATVQPIHDAIVANAQAWADSQNPPPTSDEINTKYGLLPTDRDAILANWQPVIGIKQILPKKPNAQSAASSAATGVAVVGIATAAATWGLAAYRGVSMAAELKGWWDKASGLVKKVT